MNAMFLKQLSILSASTLFLFSQTSISTSPSLDWRGWTNILELSEDQTPGEYISGSFIPIENLPAEFNQLGLLSLRPNTQLGDTALVNDASIRNYWTSDSDANGIPDSGNKYIESFLLITPYGGENITDSVVTFSNSFGGAVFSENTYNIPSSAESWAYFENDNADLYPYTFPNGGTITFQARTEGTDVDIAFYFEKNVYPDNSPDFATSTQTISGTDLQSYSVSFNPITHNYPAEQAFSYFLLRILTRDANVHIENIRVDDFAGVPVPKGESLSFNGYCLSNPYEDSPIYSTNAFIKVFDTTGGAYDLLSYTKSELISDQDFSVSITVPDQENLDIQLGYVLEGPNSLSSQNLPPVLLFTDNSLSNNGLRSLSAPYTETEGVIAIEAESYHSKSNNPSESWNVFSEGSGYQGAVFTGSNGSFLQVTPDDGGVNGWPNDAYVDYLIYVPKSARYHFYSKWTGMGDNSDSIYYNVREIEESIWSNSFSRWYQDSGNDSLNFADYGYDGLGSAEVNARSVDQNPIYFDFPQAGYYTLRISSREDGAAIDAMKFVREGYDPNSEGAANAVSDSFNFRVGTSSRLTILNNDTGNYELNSLLITVQPSYGSLSVNFDGTLDYVHDGSSNQSDSFSYSISDGTTISTADVSLFASNDLRLDTNYVQMPDAPPATSSSLTFYDAYPGLTFNVANGFNSIPNVDDKLFVVSGKGVVYLIDNIKVNPESIEILDISNRIYEEGERAMKSIAAHPNWLSNGYVYITYNYVDDWNTFTNSAGGYNNSYRVSRFTMSRTYPYSIDINSEKILIDQELEGKWHSVASIRFGSDGYLYFGSGDDEGDAQRDSFGNSQYIDKNYLSGLFRIDVDLEPGDLGSGSDDANVWPNTHPSVVLHDGLPGYEIPADNPFIGSTSFNGVSVDPNQVIKEFFIVGLRNPWQFSLEDYDNDSVVDEIWVGDVGYASSGEIGRYNPGENGGWAWHENFDKNFNHSANSTFNGASVENATIRDPQWQILYPWASSEGDQYSGNSVTGGFYYDGDLPLLKDKYIFGDFVTAHIWALDPTIPNPDSTNGGITRVGGVTNVVQFLKDPASDDLLILDRNSGIKRVTAQPVVDNNFPQKLSDTNFFQNLSSMTANPGGIYYNVNLRFWSDYAEKYRWFLINESTKKIGFTENGPWSYPDGMVFVKHFEYPTQWESFTRDFNGQTITDRRPVENSPQRKIETRFLVHTTDGGAYGVSYRWENTNTGTQNEAHLATENGDNFDIEITLDGETITTPWTIPTRDGCIICHNEPAGYSLSYNTRQLNTSGAIENSTGNFIELLHQYGYLSGYDPNVHQNLPRHTRPDEDAYSLEHRARSYIDVNCAYCHQENGTGNVTGAIWDGRAHLNLESTNLVNGAVYRGKASPDHKMLTSGNADYSVLYNRMSGSSNYAQMPPLAKNYVDYEGSELLANWINIEAKPYTNYNEWKGYYFGGAAPYPIADPEADGDNDGYSNYWEWLTQTNGYDANDYWSPSLTVDAEKVSVNMKGLSNRSIRILHTENLSGEWTEWDGNPYENLPLNPNNVTNIEQAIESKGFFKFEIEE